MLLSKKRLFAATLAIVLLLPGLAAAVSPFVDVTPGRFYEAPINWAASNGITTGSPAGSNTFKPDNAVTRGEVVTFLKRYNDNVVGDTLGQLSCSTNQVAHWNGSSWVCSGVTIAETVTAQSRTVDTNPSVGNYPTVIVGNNGLPLITHYDNTNGDLRLSTCLDQNCGTTTNSILDSASVTSDLGMDTSGMIGANGLPFFSYYSWTAGALRVFACTTTSCNAGSGLNLTVGGSQGEFTSVATGSDGFPVISFAANGGVGVFHCTSADCGAGTGTAAGSAVSFDPTANGKVQATALAVGSDGFPIVAFIDNWIPEDLWIRHCSNVTCSLGTDRKLDTMSDPSTPGLGFANPGLRLVIGSDGLPAIAYSDAFNSDVRFYHCNDVSCSTGTKRVLASAGNVGAYISMAVGVDGLPTIAYVDIGTNSDLVYYRCQDVACSSGFATAIDTPGDVGLDQSMVIAADGRPLIAYLDYGNRSLKTANVNLSATGVAFG